MKIAFAVSTLKSTSGIVRVVRNIAEALAKEGCVEISIICTGKENSSEDSLPGNIRVYNLDIDRYGKRKKYLRYTGALRKLFSVYKPDVLVVSGMEHIPFYHFATGKIPETNRIAWEHRNFSAAPKFRLEWIGKRLAMKCWNGVLCITRKDYAQYRDYQGSDRGLWQIYNLTDFSAERKAYAEDSAGIMSCGTLEHIKGFDMLLTVAETVFREKPLWKWDIYGEGSRREYLTREICARGLENNIRLMGFDPNVQSKFGEYALFVLTSRAEGMGMVLIEAQKAGLPVVSFDIFCGPSDVITDGINGYLIPPFDTEEMAARIIELIENKEKRKRFSECSEFHHREFEKSFIVDKWKKMLGLPD